MAWQLIVKHYKNTIKIVYSIVYTIIYSKKKNTWKCYKVITYVNIKYPYCILITYILFRYTYN